MPQRWTKTQARAELALIAQDLAEFFGIAAPPVIATDYHTGRDWEYRIGDVELWTIAGRAECNVTISATFAHRYFRFGDPSRANEKIFDAPGVSLNVFSGKWNRITAAPDDLTVFRAYNRRDFRKVAEPNPDPQEVAAWRAIEAERAARFTSYLESLAP